MSSPIDVVKRLLAGATDEAIVRELVAPTATYVSLCISNPDLKRIMPYAGVHSKEGYNAVYSTFARVNAVWSNEAFAIEKIFASGGDVAVFGRFTYRARTTGKAYESLFSIRAEVVDGKVVYMQFMEDTLGTAATFARGGTVRYEVEEGKPFDIIF
ncbi:hypothetical protein NLG97_g2273 [Lecanicillium saksenae]|uniref:Uncharacterized protein n=1 Tax=Lecanicillium saksenae TaxID=468837 RepID=A0ACC1R360_9HYPO|nr:hypothetical protein NLG97_g2273 [Lecanicillium saksenae]